MRGRTPTEPRRIAIVGAGVSGLTCAHLLHPEHEITVFEAADYAGGHTNTIDVETPDGPVAVDTGFIVFNDRNYPCFEALLAELGVPSQRSDMSFGVSDPAGPFAYASTSPNGLFAQRGNLVRPSFHRMLADVRRFQREAPELLRSDRDPSLAQWLEERGFSDQFVEKLIVPQAAAVWSADPDQMATFPARFLIEFFDNHGMFDLRDRPQWRTVVGGSREYVRALTAPFRDRVRLSTPIRSIARDDFGVTVLPEHGGAERFDEVIVATHADRALAMLADPDDAERDILGRFRYQPNEATLHTDASLLPSRRRAWASWNYHLLPSPAGRPTVTYHMNRLQRLACRRDHFVTLNRTEAVDPAAVIRTIPYSHPVFTAGSVAAQRRWPELAGGRRTWFCGAYWGWGFHEDGVVSALRVARSLGARDDVLVSAA
jgi:predicted NAD/FAD-binding protein